MDSAAGGPIVGVAENDWRHDRERFRARQQRRWWIPAQTTSYRKLPSRS